MRELRSGHQELSACDHSDAGPWLRVLGLGLQGFCV